MPNAAIHALARRLSPLRAPCALLCLCTILPYGSLAADLPGTDAGADGVDELVVSATRASGGLPQELLGASVTVITPDELQERQVRLVSDVLRDVPGVAVNRAGGVGALTEVRIRGTEADHVLVLIDGMEASDPYYGEYDFAGLLADDVARIEVLRGQQSALYGSDAIGGVIQYFTLGGREAPGVSARIERGSFGTTDASARLAGVDGALDYSLSGALYHTAGTPTSRFGTRDVGAEDRVASSKLSLVVNDALTLRAVGRFSQARADFNEQDFNYPSPTYGYVIDTTDVSVSRFLQGLVGADLALWQGRWQQSLVLQGLSARRESDALGARDSSDAGSRIKLSYVDSLRLGDDRQTQQFVFAVDDKRDTFQNTGPLSDPQQGLAHSIDNLGVVGQYTLLADQRLGVDAAVRYDHDTHFRDASTYRLQFSYRFEGGTRLHAAAGSGIKNPTATELFGYDPTSFIGNPNLKPEKSRGWEAGVEQVLADERVKMGVTWAQSRLTDAIATLYDANFIATVVNTPGNSPQRTAEFFATARVADQWKLDASYSWLDAREQGLPVVRRPPHLGSLNLVWQSLDSRLSAHLGLRYNGATEDYNFTAVGPPRVQLGSYELLQVGGEMRLRDAVEVYARVENLLDQRYEDVYTYKTPGRAVYVGIRTHL